MVSQMASFLDLKSSLSCWARQQEVKASR